MVPRVTVKVQTAATFGSCVRERPPKGLAILPPLEPSRHAIAFRRRFWSVVVTSYSYVVSDDLPHGIPEPPRSLTTSHRRHADTTTTSSGTK